jgi:hypothetical protein
LATRRWRRGGLPSTAWLPDKACQDMGVNDAFGFEDFDRYVEENGISEEDYPAAFAQWIAERTGGPVPRFEKVEELGA